jgi:hypothetical protein
MATNRAARINTAPEYPDWMRHPGRHCAGRDLELFFPEGPAHKATRCPALQICHDCPVRLRCLEWAFEHDEWGIWAGTTRAMRTEMLRVTPRGGRVYWPSEEKKSGRRTA